MAKGYERISDIAHAPKSRVDTIEDTFNYIFEHPKSAYKPLHLKYGQGKSVDKDLYELIKMLSLSGCNEIIVELHNALQLKRYGVEKNSDEVILHWFQQYLYQIFSAFNNAGCDDATLHELKKLIHHIAAKNGQSRQIVNLAAMAERQRKSANLAESDHQIIRENLTKDVKKLNDNKDLLTHSKYALLDNVSTLPANHKEELFRSDAEKVAIRKKKGRLNFSAYAIAAVVCVGEAVVPAAILLTGGATIPIFLITLLCAYTVNILLFSLSQKSFMKNFFLGRFYLKDDGSPMSKTQVTLSKLALVFCFAGAALAGTLSLYGFMLLSPLLLVPGLVVAVTALVSYTGLFNRACVALTNSNLTKKLKNFIHSKFVEPSWPMKIVNGLALVLILATVATIAIVSYQYLGAVLASFFVSKVGLGASSAIAAKVVTAIALPIFTYFSLMNISNVVYGLTHVAQVGCNKIADTFKSIGRSLGLIKSPAPECTHAVKGIAEDDVPKYKALETLAAAERVKTWAKRLFLLVCTGFNSVGQGSGPAHAPTLKHFTDNLRIPSNVAQNVIWASQTANSVAAIVPAVIETVQNARTGKVITTETLNPVEEKPVVAAAEKKESSATLLAKNVGKNGYLRRCRSDVLPDTQRKAASSVPNIERGLLVAQAAH